MRLRSGSLVNKPSCDLHGTKKVARYSLRGTKTPFRRRRLRSLNGARTPSRIDVPKKSPVVSKWNGTSYADDQENFNISSSSSKMKNLDLSDVVSPRRFRSLNKDQSAKIKRLDACKIEIDPDGSLCHSICTHESRTRNETVLNHSFTSDPRTKLLELCGQTEVKSMSSFFDAECLENIIKIGEGVYGEVFQSNKSAVIKIFPIDGSFTVNGERQMESHRVFPEVFISKQLTELGFKYRQNRAVNFIQLRRCAVVNGKWPRELVKAWKKYEADNGSDNECLDFLPETQEWMVLEFDYAGKPLGTFKFTSYREAHSVIEQIALSLAAAESALQFEHRDLHWLNVLVKPTKQTKLRYRVNGLSYSVQTEGIQVCIIDFTVSRLCHDDPLRPLETRLYILIDSLQMRPKSRTRGYAFITYFGNDGNVVYVDMSNSPEIFECEGDYQFEIYRMMRDMNGNNWRPFKPITNLYWLHYLMGKLIHESLFPRRDPDGKAVQSELAALRDNVLSGDYDSTMSLVRNSFFFDSCRIE